MCGHGHLLTLRDSAATSAVPPEAAAIIIYTEYLLELIYKKGSLRAILSCWFIFYGIKVFIFCVHEGAMAHTNQMKQIFRKVRRQT